LRSRVGCRFHVLRSRTHFLRYRVRRVWFSCFALLDSFWAVPRASSTIFMYCAPKHVLGGIGSVGSRFHVMRSRSHFWRYKGRRVPFSCFALPDSFSSEPRKSGPVLIFCAPGLIFGGTEGAASRLHVLNSLTHFGLYRGRQVLSSCFTLSDSFWEVPSASGPIFGTDGVGPPFSCFALPNSFSTVPRSSDPVFMFCVPESGPIFMFCALGLVFNGTGGVESRFHILRSQTHF
jgi:hypothetical protein